MLWMIKQEKWELDVLFCCSPFAVGWGERGHRIEQAGFWKGFLKKNNEQPRQKNQPETVWFRTDLLAFEYPFNCVIKNLNLKIILNADTLSECFFFFPKGWRKAPDNTA